MKKVKHFTGDGADYERYLQYLEDSTHTNKQLKGKCPNCKEELPDVYDEYELFTGTFFINCFSCNTMIVLKREEIDWIKDVCLDEVYLTRIDCCLCPV